AVLREALEAVEHVVHAVRSAYGLCGIDSPTPDEDRETAKTRPIRRIEQVVAPFDGRGQRPLSLGEVGDASADDVELPTEAFEQRRRIEDAHAGGCELDRERKPIQTTA